MAKVCLSLVKTLWWGTTSWIRAPSTPSFWMTLPSACARTKSPSPMCLSLTKALSKRTPQTTVYSPRRTSKVPTDPCMRCSKSRLLSSRHTINFNRLTLNRKKIVEISWTIVAIVVKVMLATKACLRENLMERMSKVIKWCRQLRATRVVSSLNKTL